MIMSKTRWSKRVQLDVPKGKTGYRGITVVSSVRIEFSMTFFVRYLFSMSKTQYVLNV